MAIVINGSGTVTGLAVGGLPDGTVDAGTLATDSVDSAEIVDGSVDRSKLNTSIADSGNATAITIDAAENIGIGAAPESGTSSDVSELDMGLMSLSIWKGESQPNDSASYGYNCYKTGGFTYKAKKTSTGADNRPVVYEQAYGYHKFRVGAAGSADAAITWTDAMKIANDGKVNIGGTDIVAHLNVERKDAGAVLGVWNSHSDGVLMQVFSPAGANRGSISLSGSTTTYATSSDYRLKENVDYTWDATTRLKQLKPARFNWIEDDANTLVDGFIAHEVSSIVPEAIVGTKDAMTAEVLYVEGDELPEGKSIGDVKKASAIDPQGIDQSKLVPLLVKTIQELEARITALEA